MYLDVGGESGVLSQTEYSNAPMVTLAGEQAYIYIDGYGKPEELAALGDAIQGKILVCSRGGDVSFFEKGNNAIAAGAIATIVYNNQAGSINMDLTDYSENGAVCLRDPGRRQVLKANATPVTGSGGEILYYAGTLTVGKQIASGDLGLEYNTMSSFSSWGVPGSLTLKPEITAPGGNIYSVNGKIPAARPMKICPVRLWLRPRWPAWLRWRRSISGKRTWPGKPDDAAAVSAEFAHVHCRSSSGGGQRRELLVYPAAGRRLGQHWRGGILGYLYPHGTIPPRLPPPMGRSRAELGDDPQRTGTYRVSFTLNNLTQEDRRYTWRQISSPRISSPRTALLTWLPRPRPLAAEVRYWADGVAFVPTAKLDCDLDETATRMPAMPR